jgi:hypothetical protein
MRKKAERINAEVGTRIARRKARALTQSAQRKSGENRERAERSFASLGMTVKRQELKQRRLLRTRGTEAL